LFVCFGLVFKFFQVRSDTVSPSKHPGKRN